LQLTLSTASIVVLIIEAMWSNCLCYYLLLYYL